MGDLLPNREAACSSACVSFFSAPFERFLFLLQATLLPFSESAGYDYDFFIGSGLRVMNSPSRGGKSSGICNRVWVESQLQRRLGAA
jgi:hypothetical protein